MEAAGVSEEPEARSVRPVGSPWSPDLGDFFFRPWREEVHGVDRTAGPILVDTPTNTARAAIMRKC